MNLHRRIAVLGLVPHFVSCFYGSNALAHGMSKPGPHGGYIKMPGAFHTELVPQGNDGFKIYLLDVDIKNPTVRASSVTGSIKRNEKETQVACSKKADHFDCVLADGLRLESGDKLSLRASRKGSFVGLASYKVPLKFADF